MGQKIIPTSLRSYRQKNWCSNWIENPLHYSNLLSLDLELKKYLFHIFGKKNIYVQNIYIYKKDKTFLIYIYISSAIFHKKKSNFFISYGLKKLIENELNLFYLIQTKVVLINLNLYFLKKKKVIHKIYSIFKQHFQFYQGLLRIRPVQKTIYLLHLVILTKNALLLSIFFLKLLKSKKFQKKTLENIERDLYYLFLIYPQFLGYKIQFKGKLQGKNRTKIWLKKNGCLPLNSITKNIYYAMQPIETPAGICSIKIWLYIK